MFNGIIYKTGKIKFIQKNKNNFTIGIENVLNLKDKDIGSSISCNGVCLTLTNIKRKIIFFYLSVETLNKSNLRFINLEDPINMEKSLVYGQKISGHFVQGHVDTTAAVKKIIFVDKTWLISFQLKNKKLSKFLVEKASIGINGVSLTIAKVKNNFFEVNIIPHTLELTNLKNLKSASIVNAELDIFFKYIMKLSK